MDSENDDIWGYIFGYGYLSFSPEYIDPDYAEWVQKIKDDTKAMLENDYRAKAFTFFKKCDKIKA